MLLNIKIFTTWYKTKFHHHNMQIYFCWSKANRFG